jgi:chromosome segregation ATPase
MSDTESTEMNDLLDKFEQEISNKFNLRIKELEDKIQNLENKNEELEEQIKDLEDENVEFQEQIKDLKDENVEFQEQIKDLKDKNVEFQEQIKDLKLDRWINKITILGNHNTNLIKKFKELKDENFMLKTKPVSVKVCSYNGIRYYKSSDNLLYDKFGNPQGFWDETHKIIINLDYESDVEFLDDEEEV